MSDAIVGSVLIVRANAIAISVEGEAYLETSSLKTKVKTTGAAE